MENLIYLLSVEGRGFWLNAIRTIFAMLDNVAFFLFAKAMGLMFDIAKLTAEKGDAIAEFLGPLQERIYVILSIYMVFKVTVSLLTYIVNPDSMTDKSQGAGKLVQRIIISLAILSFFPYGFRMLNKLQADIIGNNTIPKIVLGVTGEVSNPEGVGNEIAFEVYNGTFVSDPESSDGRISISPEKVSAIVDDITAAGENDSVYKYEYIPFAGFACGILLTVLTLSMCVDVSIRVFKLMILQMVAPIPIISYMDPKQAKDGTFSKWLKLTISVWAEVFIRLFVIYFILLVIEQLISNGGPLVSNTNLFVKIALVIGLLFFAKDAPKFICDAIGIKPPEKGLFGGLGQIMAAGAIGAGAVGAGIAVGRAQKGNGWHAGNAAKALFAGTGAAFGSIGTGITAASSAKDHQAKAVMDARNKYMNNVLNGNGFGARAFSTAANVFAGYDIDREISKYGAIEASAKKLRGYANGEGAKFYSDVGFDLKDADGHVIGNASKNEIERAISDASMNGGNAIIRDASGNEVLNLGAASGSLAKKLLGDAEEFAGDTYMNELQSGGFEARFGAAKANNAKQILGSLTGTYANAVGITTKEASKHRNSQIKVNEKSAGNKGFILKQKKGGK